MAKVAKQNNQRTIFKVKTFLFVWLLIILRHRSKVNFGQVRIDVAVADDLIGGGGVDEGVVDVEVEHLQLLRRVRHLPLSRPEEAGRMDIHAVFLESLASLAVYLGSIFVVHKKFRILFSSDAHVLGT